MPATAPCTPPLISINRISVPSTSAILASANGTPVLVWLWAPAIQA